MEQHPVWNAQHFLHPAFPSYGMGRIPQIDFRDRQFMLQHTLDDATRAPSTKIFWYSPRVLDQGATPMCVGFAGEAYLAAGPVINKYYKEPPDLYKLAQENDEWPGENYDGTSVHGLFKALTTLNVIKSYAWAPDYETCAHEILSNGPVVFGTDWYDSMFEPDKDGFCNIPDTAQVAGGHCFLVLGVDDTFKCPDGSIGRLRIQNSWGASWGQKGRAWFSSKVANKLLAAQGEAATSREIKARMATPQEAAELAGE